MLRPTDTWQVAISCVNRAAPALQAWPVFCDASSLVDVVKCCPLGASCAASLVVIRFSQFAGLPQVLGV
jgi:hypothetical protein